MSEPSPDARAFLRDHIESYEQLELLLLLRAQARMPVSETALVGRLGISASLVSAALAGLEAAGLLQMRVQGSEKSYAYITQSDSLEATIARVADAYRDDPIPIIKLMSANAIERLRKAALRTFADAFLLRRDKNRG